jgi:uncharacterized protein (TIGR03382 family)
MTGRISMKTVPVATVLLLPLFSLIARAAPAVPPDDEYVAWRCGDGSVMDDPQADDAAFLGDLDIVGADIAPAALRAVDDTFLYLRIRLDDDPAPGGVPNAGGVWGFEFDLDGNPTDYELLIVADATTANPIVAVYTNDTVTIPNSPADPADRPPAAMYPFDAAAGSLATSTTTGGTPDYFLDIVVPWEDLEPLGLHPDSVVSVWVASSSVSDALNGDFACNTGSGSDVVLDDSTSSDDRPDPDAGGDNDLPRLEGGGGFGCDAGGGGGVALMFVLALVLVARQRVRE